MKVHRTKILILIIFILGCSSPEKKRVIEEVSLAADEELPYPKLLSEWNLFENPIHTLEPVVKGVPYKLNTPLFTDYAYKSRFVKLPEGGKMNFRASQVLSFPDETILVKTFYYPADFRKEDQNWDLIETRLLVKEKEEWKALTYVWNEQQTDAELVISGQQVPVSWLDKNGKRTSISYSVPNLVQCKSCHEKDGKMTPIGPKARNLSNTYQYDGGKINQLMLWEKMGLLAGMENMSMIKPMPLWDNIESGSLNERARAWLDINCAHCHSNDGPAKNSGLYLGYLEKDPYRIGISKPPVAAGRGSAGMLYSIVPGQPEKSILYQRINSLDPGVMMPELGRKTIHQEGVKTIKSWISNLK